MKLAFALYKYFPFGGLQKDMLAIARACVERGHEVTVYCREWDAERPATIQVCLLPVRALSNDGKNHSFHKKLAKQLEKDKPDLVVGFNKIPGVDIYYAADTSFKAKLEHERPKGYRLLPRYRRFVRDEEMIFAPGAKVHILSISPRTTEEYQQMYATPDARFTQLPPGISRDRINAKGDRQYYLHREFDLSEDQMIVLLVGSGFRTKGLDRAIDALAALPESLRATTRLMVVGQDKPEDFLKQAEERGVFEQVHFLGGRKDVPDLLRSADVLIHPAYRENTGTVLLEAAVSCLPVLTTDVCGYASYIAEKHLGVVLPSPFKQQQLNRALELMLSDVERLKKWRANGWRFAKTADIYNMPARAAGCIEAVARERGVL